MTFAYSDDDCIKHFQNQIWHIKKTQIVLFCGGYGDGKSTASYKFSKAIDPTMDSERVFYYPEEVIDFFKDPAMRWKGATWEESEIEADARRAMSEINRTLTHSIAVIRSGTRFLAINAPFMSWQDKKINQSINADVLMLGVDEEAKESHGLIRIIHKNYYTGEWRHAPLIVQGEDGEDYIYDDIRFGPMDQAEREAYELRKETYNRCLHTNNLAILKRRRSIERARYGYKTDYMMEKESTKFKKQLEDIEARAALERRAPLSSLA